MSLLELDSDARAVYNNIFSIALYLNNMNKTPVVFTPLRVVLISTIVLSNLAALIALFKPQQAWADMVGLVGIIFVMMFLFVILLELTWLHYRGKHNKDAKVHKHYQIAKLIYTLLLISGIIMGVVILL